MVKTFKKLMKNFEKHINFSVFSCISSMGKTIENKNNKKKQKYKKCHYGENRRKFDEKFQKHMNFWSIFIHQYYWENHQKQQK